MAEEKKPSTTTIDEKAKENRKKVEKRTVDAKVEQKDDGTVQTNPQPEFTEDGIQINKNVFPPPGEDAQFNGTGAANREVRRIQEENKKDN